MKQNDIVPSHPTQSQSSLLVQCQTAETEPATQDQMKLTKRFKKKKVNPITDELVELEW